MAEVILTVLRRPETAFVLLNAAGKLAALMGETRISALAVREAFQTTALAAEVLIGEADSVIDARERERERMTALKAAFDRWAAEAGEAAATARWIEAEGSAATHVAERGSRADLIVAASPAEDDRATRQMFRAALFGTDRPVLMLPPGATTAFGRCIAIAWRDEKRAVRAVIPALRWLAVAAEVHVLVGVRDGSERPTFPRVLLEHGIRADLHAIPIGSAPFGRTLLDKARELSCDLLVMGAYAHSPLRQLILGGVTSYMLAHADLPVLMRH